MLRRLGEPDNVGLVLGQGSTLSRFDPQSPQQVILDDLARLGVRSIDGLALDPATGEWVVMRVPYPLGFYSRGLDGRIDDPNAGWKGRAVWADFGTNTPWHLEGGPGTKSKMVKFQLRPDPLAY